MKSESMENSRPRHCHNILGVVWSGETWVVPQAVIGKVQAYPIPKNVKEVHVFFFFLFKFFFSTFIYFGDRERQSMNGGGAEREGDTESETGSRL